MSFHLLLVFFFLILFYWSIKFLTALSVMWFSYLVFQDNVRVIIGVEAHASYATHSFCACLWFIFLIWTSIKWHLPWRWLANSCLVEMKSNSLLVSVKCDLQQATWTKVTFNFNVNLMLNFKVLPNFLKILECIASFCTFGSCSSFICEPKHFPEAISSVLNVWEVKDHQTSTKVSKGRFVYGEILAHPSWS